MSRETIGERAQAILRKGPGVIRSLGESIVVGCASPAYVQLDWHAYGYGKPFQNAEWRRVAGDTTAHTPVPRLYKHAAVLATAKANVDVHLLENEGLQHANVYRTEDGNVHYGLLERSDEELFQPLPGGEGMLALGSRLGRGLYVGTLSLYDPQEDVLLTLPTRTVRTYVAISRFANELPGVRLS